MALKILSCFVLITVATCIPVHIHHHDSDHHAENEENHHNIPAKYDFNYNVHDEHTGDIKSHQESRNGDSVQGRYEVIEPDGHKRIVEYSVDKHSGFKAVVHRVPTDIQIPSPQKFKLGSSSLGNIGTDNRGQIQQHQHGTQIPNSGHRSSDEHYHQAVLLSSNNGHYNHDGHGNIDQHIPQVITHTQDQQHELPDTIHQETDLQKFSYNNPTLKKAHSHFQPNTQVIHVPAVFEDAEGQYGDRTHYQPQINLEINALASDGQLHGEPLAQYQQGHDNIYHDEKYVAIPDHQHFAGPEHETVAIQHISDGQGSTYDH